MLSDLERIDVLKFISKTHRDIHENRIKRELQVVITTLSFYAACIVFKFKWIKSEVDTIFSIVACLAFIFVAIYVYLYMESSGESNNINQKIAEEAEDRLSGLSGNLYDICEIRKKVQYDNLIENRLSYKSIFKIGSLLMIDLKSETDHQKMRYKSIISIAKLLGIKLDKDDHPSANRWLWQACIVILGALVANILIDYCIGIIIDILLVILIIVIYCQKDP